MSKIVPVQTPAEIGRVAALAREIWNSHYVPIIGQEQVDYMVEVFQSASAISAQIANGYHYYLVQEQEGVVGYFALVPDPASASMLLSKIYVLSAWRGQGVGRQIVAFSERLCAEHGFKTLWLTVNKCNTGSIAFYLSMGFKKEAEVVNDIGKGFVMDDYRMVKRIASASASA